MMRRTMGFRRPAFWIQPQETTTSTTNKSVTSRSPCAKKITGDRSCPMQRPSRIYPSSLDVDASGSGSSSSRHDSFGVLPARTPTVLLRRFSWIVICLVLAVHHSLMDVKEAAFLPAGGTIVRTDETTPLNFALRIAHPDEFLLFDWPIQGFLKSDLTIELDYRTSKDSRQASPANHTVNYSTRIDDKVLIIGNDRESNDGQQYGRMFALYILKQSGQLVVEFSGYNPITKSFASGSITTESAHAINNRKPLRFDDGEWHRIRLIRESRCDAATPGSMLRTNLTRISSLLYLSVDGTTFGTVEMPLGHDYDGQEQRVLIGGGNDRQFRLCDIDNVRLWTVARLDVTHHKEQKRAGSLSPARESCVDNTDPSLIMHLTFDSKSDGVLALDCASRGGGAIRVGEHLQNVTAFVPGAPFSQTCPSCRTARDASFRTARSRRLSTAVVTFLGVDCDNKGVWFEKGHLYQLEAYLGALWLDVNRLQMKLVILTDCVPPSILKPYTTRYVSFLDIRDDDKVNFTLPSECQVAEGEVDAVIKRFLVIRHVLEHQQHFDDVEYIVHADLRDSRIFHWPNWTAPNELWLQSIRRDVTNVCGGFQAGTKSAMTKLMLAMEKSLIDQNCQKDPWDDQGVLNDLFRNGRLGTPSDRIVVDGPIVNSQHTRTFSGRTAFVHGDWWMSKKMVNEAYAAYAYPEAVIDRRTRADKDSCFAKASQNPKTY